LPSPFPAGLIGQYGNDQAAVIAYAGTLVMAGLSLDLIWRMRRTITGS